MEQAIAAILVEGNWRLTDNHADVYEKTDDEVIFADCGEVLQIELEARHPAPEGFTRVKTVWPNVFTVSDGLVVSDSCELPFSAVLELARTEGSVEIRNGHFSEEIQALLANGGNDEFVLNGWSPYKLVYAPKRVKRRNQRRRKKAADRLKNAEIPVANLLDRLAYDLWNRIKGETKVGRWLRWVDTGGKCREDWMEQIVEFSDALNKLCGEGEHRKTENFG